MGPGADGSGRGIEAECARWVKLATSIDIQNTQYYFLSTNFARNALNRPNICLDAEVPCNRLPGLCRVLYHFDLNVSHGSHPKNSNTKKHSLSLWKSSKIFEIIFFGGKF